MSNTVNKPYGLIPVKDTNGAPYTGAATLYYVPQADTTAIFIGDCVKTVAGGSPLNGTSAVTLAGARNAALAVGPIRGVVVGIGTANSAGAVINADPADLNAVSIPATKAKDYYVWVADSPDLIFEAQADAIVVANFNKNCPLFVSTAPSGVVNQSQSYAQGSAAAVTATLPLRLLGGVNAPDNDLTAPGTYGRVYVQINTHELASNTVGV